MRSYASSATTLTERTAVMANLSAYQGVGFILGPRELQLQISEGVTVTNTYVFFL